MSRKLRNVQKVQKVRKGEFPFCKTGQKTLEWSAVLRFLNKTVKITFQPPGVIPGLIPLVRVPFCHFLRGFNQTRL